jgi:hypothetical protein
MWIAAGATLGGMVVGALAVVLCLLDTGAGAADYAPVVAIIAGTLGAVGGGIAGMVCAVVTALLDRWTGGLTASGYAVVAATVTATVALVFGLWLMQPGAVLQSDQLWGWVLFPMAVSSAVASVAGWRLWREPFLYRPSLGTTRRTYP